MVKILMGIVDSPHTPIFFLLKIKICTAYQNLPLLRIFFWKELIIIEQL